MKRWANFLVLLTGVTSILTSCFNNDDVGDNFYTFKGNMMGEFIKANPERFSEFARMLDTTGTTGLLNAYGKYTCFAPTNEALFEFYAKRGHTSLKDFPLDSIDKIVKDHIISGAIYASSQFRNGRLPKVSMSDRYITAFRQTDNLGNPIIVINETSQVIDEDSVSNGVVHTINEVLQPTNLTMIDVIKKDKRFTMFYDAIIATGLQDQLTLIEDKSYAGYPTFVPRYKIEVWSQAPKKRKYGYTVLMESDSTFKSHGINNLDDLKAYAKSIYDQVYPGDASITDITNRKNSFNRFVAYHLINKQISYSKFIYDLDNDGVQEPTKTHQIQSYDMFEYLEPMCPNTLIEVRTLRTRNEKYGLFNMTDSVGDKAVRIIKSYSDKDALNGVYHEIDNILTYSKEFVSVLSSKRLRMDISSFFPEFMNNNFRAPGELQAWDIPSGYLERMSKSNVTIFYYLPADDRFDDYQGDEVFMIQCMYDFTVTTLPIPAGTYEVRFGYYSNGARGVAQIYLDGQPCGIPLNLNTWSSDPKIGYELPGTVSTDPYGYENDKMMHNRGYMKGPSSFTSISKVWYTEVNARMSDKALRKILGIYTFKKDTTHTFRAKASKAGEFMFDYLEFVPMEAIEREGID